MGVVMEWPAQVLPGAPPGGAWGSFWPWPRRAKASRVASERGAPSRADEAMSRYAAGDDEAFAAVYDELAPRLGAFLHRLTRDRDQTDDLLQQTFLQIHDARGRFLPGAAVLPWAYAIARRLFLDANDRRVRRDRRHDDLEDFSELLAATDPSPEAVLEGEVLAKTIGEALDQMPENQRVAFLLVKQEGLSMAEAAGVLGTTVATVKLRAHRAYERLRSALGWKEPPRELHAPPRATRPRAFGDARSSIGDAG